MKRNQMKKRMTGILLCLMLMLAVFPMTAHVETVVLMSKVGVE